VQKATAPAFAKAGAKVVITGRREKEGAEVAAEITKTGGSAAFVRADVAKAEFRNIPSVGGKLALWLRLIERISEH
jgi:NAD(P)-dependent dehydrogenase (short-subunit alcohol dehydrogenase family)